MAQATNTRIDIRTDSYRKNVIVKAAKLTHKNITQFILERVYPEAEKIVNEHEQSSIVLNDEAWKSFLAKLDEPPKELTELKKLFDEPSIFEQNNEKKAK